MTMSLTIQQQADTVVKVGTEMLGVLDINDKTTIIADITETKYLANLLQRSIDQKAERTMETMIDVYNGNVWKAYLRFCDKLDERPELADCDAALVLEKKFRERLNLD